MAYEPHTYVTWHGLLGGPSTNQTWSIGLRMSISPAEWLGVLAIDPGALDDFTTAMLAAFTDSWPGTEFGKDMWLMSCKTALIQADGTYVAPPTVVGTLATVAYGTDNTLLPYQVCLVGTLKHIGVGRGNFGRVYYPTVASLPAVGGLIPESARDDYHGRHADFINAVNAAADAVISGAAVNIYNRVTGTQKSVDQVGVGRVLDTQRRRRDQLIENIDYLPL